MWRGVSWRGILGAVVCVALFLFCCAASAGIAETVLYSSPFQPLEHLAVEAAPDGAPGAMALHGRVPQAVGMASYGAYVRRMADASDAAHAVERMRVQHGMDILYMDESGAHYIVPDGLPLVERLGVLDAPYAYDQNMESWVWQHTLADVPRTFSGDGQGRWYLPDFAAGQAENALVYVAYARDVVACMAYFYDEDGALLGSFSVPQGQSVQALFASETVRALIPAENARRFIAWETLGAVADGITAPVSFRAQYAKAHAVSFFLGDASSGPAYVQQVADGGRVDWAEAARQVALPEGFVGWRMLDAQTGQALGAMAEGTPVTAPVSLVAQVTPRHPVRFYLEGEEAPLHEQVVWEGEGIDWSRAPVPMRQNARFLGWQAAGEHTDTERVMGPMRLVAQFAPLHRVSFVDAAGVVLHEAYADTGKTVDVEAVSIPQREGLHFSHWTREDGGAFTSDTPVSGPLRILPVYEATISFWDGETLFAQRSVREGLPLVDFPVNPVHADGRLFLAWDVDMVDVPVWRDMSLHAVYAVEIVFVYGLYGEHMQAVTVRMGDAVAPPDASVLGYEYVWSPAMEGYTAQTPLTVIAAYTARDYTVRFVYEMDEGEQVYDVQRVAFGQAPQMPPTPSLAGYTFLGWDWPPEDSPGVVEEDLTIHALLEKEAPVPESPTPEASSPETPGAGTEQPKAETMPGTATTGGTSGGTSGGTGQKTTTGYTKPAGQSIAPEEEAFAIGVYRLHRDDIPVQGIVGGTAGYAME